MKQKPGTTPNQPGADPRAVYDWLIETPANRGRWFRRARELLADSPRDGNWGAARVRLAAEIRDALPDEFDQLLPRMSVDWDDLTTRLVGLALASGTDPEPGWEILDAYSRADAISDGVLVDASNLAKEAGFRYPVALTAAAWATCVSVPAGVPGQDESGRLWDLLTMLRHASRAAGPDVSTLRFDVLVLNDQTTPKPVRLKAVCGPDDDLAPCLTVMLPEED